MEHLPIPHLYRVTNNEFLPNINSIWINESGNVIRVTKIQSKEKDQPHLQKCRFK